MRAQKTDQVQGAARSTPSQVFTLLISLAMIGITIIWLGVVSQNDQMSLQPVLWAGVAFAALIGSYAVWIYFFRTCNVATFAALYEKSPVPVVMSNRQGKVLSHNAACHTHSQILQGNSVAQMMAELFDNAPSVTYRMTRIAQTRGWAQEQISRDGSLTQVDVHYDGNLFLWHLNGFSLDDAPKKDVYSSVPMAHLDGAGQVEAVNTAFLDMFGTAPLSPKTLRNGSEVLPNQVQDLDVKGTLKPFLVIEHYTNSGRHELHFYPERASGPVGLADDVAIFDFLPVPLVKLSTEGQILQINTAAQKLFGGTVRTGQMASSFFTASGKIMSDLLQDVVHGRLWSKSEFWRLRGAENDAIFQASLSFVGGSTKDMVVVSFSDVTELKSLEAQFVQSQKMQAIGQLAGGVAHDFNNLLTAISGHCDLLLLRHDQSDPEYSDLMQIHQNANRAAALVGQLLAFSRKQNLQFRSLDIRDTIADLGHLLGRLVGEKVNLVLKHDPDVRRVRADKRQLEQVLMNLVVNARDAMLDGGDVEISTQRLVISKATERQGAVVAPGEYVAIKVKDQGGGIRDDLKRKVFEPFFTTKKAGEGTGLGLSTVYGIIKQSEGFIFVESEMGIGSTFEIILPTSTEVESTVTSAPEKTVVSANTEKVARVLLVEDEAPVRAFASRALQLRGFTVFEADSGESALTLLADPDMQVDVFVTDVIMPGVDGPTWVGQALKERPDTKVIFVSGYAEDDFSDKKNQIKGSVFLPKPFSLSDLTKAVQDILT